ncbi:hypothetical protein IFM89_029893 [Coptis chinensis]|uniref:Uncharacterized protein n=1 Tax=Coptis chinensis TaxID=261450 RepID=A0A835LK68_9MAGN|nr:hypothetical protein IFM89_029893 [Coptis chinensis]
MLVTLCPSLSIPSNANTIPINADQSKWFSKELDLSHLTQAILKDPLNATLLSNRGLCYARQKNGNRALEDAMTCVMLKPDWPKAHYRAGVAWSILEKFDAAALEFAAAPQLDPGNQDLRNAFQLRSVYNHLVQCCHVKHTLIHQLQLGEDDTAQVVR